MRELAWLISKSLGLTGYLAQLGARPLSLLEQLVLPYLIMPVIFMS
jgi:hypothetical protein